MKVSIKMSLAGLMAMAVLLASFGVFFNSSPVALAAADATIRGTVTDGAGKPVRGAFVRATMGTKSIARYSDRDGRFQIAGLQPGSYAVSADAFGFGLKTQTKDTAQAGEVKFSLSPDTDPIRLTSAEVEYLLPDTEEGKLVKSSCSGCHGFATVLKRRGMTAPVWKMFLPTMTERKFARNLGFGEPERVAAYAGALEKFFGPGAPLGPGAAADLMKIKHTPLSDAALRATITEYTIPTPGAMAHSIIVDSQRGTVWFSEYDAPSNKIARFDPDTEKFQEFPIPVPGALAHTGAILKDGTYMVAFDKVGHPVKLASVDRAGKMTLYEWPEKKQGSRVVALDPTNENRVWIVAGEETWSLDVKTKQFKAFKNPVPDGFPEGSQAALLARPGERPGSAGYALAVDSKGIPWITQLALGTIVRLDPATGETKVYHTPKMRSARGIAVDAQDNIWVADYYGNKLAKMDAKTGEVKLYQPPTPHAAPYGVTFDPRRGHMWYADTVGNNITRFDPKTEQFVEYAIPTPDSSVRFMGVDAKGRAWYGGFWSGKLGVIDPGESAPMTASR